jgi:mRNA-degrading endonuclease YafQ of YafQ-DinJ toxin-antitoxin module
MKFELELSQKFQKKYINYTKKNSALEKKFDSFFHKLRINPFQASLKTHKIYSSDFGEVFSSSATGDLRVL